MQNALHDITRRSFLKTATAGSVVGAASAFAPTLSLSKETTNTYTLRAQKTSLKLAGEKYEASTLWLYNGKCPGPEIRAKQGETIKVKFINELDEPTSIHWHGIRIRNSMDGVSGLTQEPVLPGESFDYVFTAPDAGTFWYHAHHKSWLQVTRGLYGPLIVEDDQNSFDKEHDITLMVDDWRLAENGTLDLASLGAIFDWVHGGRLGNWVTVNGQSNPAITINKNENYRVRLINACNARALEIDPKTLGVKIIGFDGISFDRVRTPQGKLSITPAQRVDLLLNSAFMEEVQGDTIPLQLVAGQNNFTIATFEFKETSNTKPIKYIPSTNELSDPDIENAARYRLVMTGGAMGQIDELIYNGEPLTNEQIRSTKQAWAFNGVANLAKQPFFICKTRRDYFD